MARNLKVLRAQVKARQLAANRKIRRLTDDKGVQIAGTKFDPRKEAKVIDRLTGVQLEAQLARLNTFMDRKTQFVAGAHGVPMTKKQWERAASVQRRANTVKERMRDKFANVFVDETGMTIAERQEKINNKRKLAGNPSVQQPWNPTTYQAKNITSEKALKRIEEQLMKQTSMQYEQQQYKDAKKQYYQIMRPVKNNKLIKLVRTLSPDQFTAMWFGTPFADAFSMAYEMAMALMRDDEKAFHSDQMHASIEEAIRLAKWAKGLNFDK